MPNDKHHDALIALGRCAQWVQHFAMIEGVSPKGPSLSEVSDACDIIERDAPPHVKGKSDARWWATLIRSNAERYAKSWRAPRD